MAAHARVDFMDTNVLSTTVWPLSYGLLLGLVARVGAGRVDGEDGAWMSAEAENASAAVEVSHFKTGRPVQPTGWKVRFLRRSATEIRSAAGESVAATPFSAAALEAAGDG